MLTINEINETINFPLLRDVGIRYTKEKEYNFVPSDDALLNSFKRVIYQCNEYEQIFEAEPTYLNPAEYGFEMKDGVMRPKLSNHRDVPDVSDEYDNDQQSEDEEEGVEEE